MIICREKGLFSVQLMPSTNSKSWLNPHSGVLVSFFLSGFLLFKVIIGPINSQNLENCSENSLIYFTNDLNTQTIS